MNIPFLDEIKSSVKAVVDAAKAEILTALQNDTAGVTAQTKKFTEISGGKCPYSDAITINGKGRITFLATGDATIRTLQRIPY